MTPLFEQIKNRPFVLSGPCVIESPDLVFEVAEKVKAISEKLGFVCVFKASFDKANRTSIHSFRGIGYEKGLEALAAVKARYQLPIVTDIHESHQAAEVGKVADILQIPAFLCRQTDLLVAAARTGCIVNIKKAQFLSGKDMRYPAQKVADSGNAQILLTERGNAYGNNDLVVDFRNLIEMQHLGYPTVMDITHAVQKPGGAEGKSSGNRYYAPFFAKAAAAMGVRGFFVETHPNPEKALSDGPNMIALHDLEKVLEQTLEFVALAEKHRK
jgi:2-dehydro-3-deoxyphosphooctonate aldolase (KDO 8-P synthase)